MSTIVLVHGALQTAATWDLVTPALRRAGHAVFTPELSGMGPRGGPMTAGITLATHIDDIVRFLELHELKKVVLAGHSYAGMVITGVAARVSSRLDHLVYVDAFVPERGQAAIDFMPEPIRHLFRTLVADDGFRIVPNDHLLDVWHLEGEARNFVRDRMWDFSMRCFTQPLADDPSDTNITRTFIACVGADNGARPVFAPFAERARREHWGYHELPTGHDCHVEMPDAVATILAKACSAPAATVVGLPTV
jgi:pimeloyl-ACP methyl ester carboxylesterase